MLGSVRWKEGDGCERCTGAREALPGQVVAPAPHACRLGSLVPRQQAKPRTAGSGAAGLGGPSLSGALGLRARPSRDGDAPADRSGARAEPWADMTGPGAWHKAREC